MRDDKQQVDLVQQLYLVTGTGSTPERATVAAFKLAARASKGAFDHFELLEQLAFEEDGQMGHASIVAAIGPSLQPGQSTPVPAVDGDIVPGVYVCARHPEMAAAIDFARAEARTHLPDTSHFEEILKFNGDGETVVCSLYAIPPNYGGKLSNARKRAFEEAT